MDREALEKLLLLGLEKGASDIHFQVGCTPLYRFHGSLVELRLDPLTREDTEAIVRHLSADLGRGEGPFPRDLDLAYEIPGRGRFRVNISRERRAFNVVVRVIPLEVPSLESLNLPPQLAQLATLGRGQVLVTGATGMGKSTTLACVIDQINRSQKKKIVTIEDPIEFIFQNRKSIITQREIGLDTESFPCALHAALRQDPDVIMVGEMRDHTTVDTALKAAETGHLVFSSIHTSDVASTLHRLVSFFPSEEQAQVRTRLADNLQAIISLRLLPNKKQTGRVPAVEIMRVTRMVREFIKDPARTSELTAYLERNSSDGMQSFDQHLLHLVRSNRISLETAWAAASNPTDFQTKLELEGVTDEKPEGLELQTAEPQAL